MTKDGHMRGTSGSEADDLGSERSQGGVRWWNEGRYR